MSDDEQGSSQDAIGFDLGALIMQDAKRTGTFKDFREMRLFAVHRIGIFGTFKRGDQQAVQVVCHEVIDEKEVDGKMTEINRFSSWRLS
jgi:hypothetical protein